MDVLRRGREVQLQQLGGLLHDVGGDDLKGVAVHHQTHGLGLGHTEHSAQRHAGVGAAAALGAADVVKVHKRQAEKEELETQLAIENNKKICLSEAQILAFLDYVCEMPADDVNKRRAIINIFVHSIYLYDDHFTLIINASKKPLSIDNIPLDDIESVFEGSGGASEGCSSLSTPAPPKS